MMIAADARRRHNEHGAPLTTCLRSRLSCPPSSPDFAKGLLALVDEVHDAFDAGAVVPAAVENDDLAGRGELLDVTLGEHLRFLALRRRGQRDHANHPLIGPLGDRLVVPPLPAVSRPWKTMMTRRGSCLRQACRRHSSTSSLRSSFS
jgi:hypothetical protein